MEKVKVLTLILEERCGLDVREAIARNIHYLMVMKATSIKNKLRLLQRSYE